MRKMLKLILVLKPLIDITLNLINTYLKQLNINNKSTLTVKGNIHLKQLIY